MLTHSKVEHAFMHFWRNVKSRILEMETLLLESLSLRGIPRQSRVSSRVEPWKFYRRDGARANGQDIPVPMIAQYLNRRIVSHWTRAKPPSIAFKVISHISRQQAAEADLNTWRAFKRGCSLRGWDYYWFETVQREQNSSIDERLFNNIEATTSCKFGAACTHVVHSACMQEKRKHLSIYVCCWCNQSVIFAIHQS